MTINKTRKPVWVVKLGSSVVADLLRGSVHFLFDQIAQLQKSYRLVLVSSGAVALGKQALGWDGKVDQLYRLQMAASVGQGILMHRYQSAFSKLGIQISQVLLTHDDFSDAKRYLNIQSTLSGLLGESILPIVNENDVVSFSEIQFGDNDQLSAMLAGAILAKRLVLLTNQAGVYNKNPRTNKLGAVRSDNVSKLIDSIQSDNPKLIQAAGDAPSEYGSGGMLSKVLSAKLAGSFGIETIVASGADPKVLPSLLGDAIVGTRIRPAHLKKAGKKVWLGSQRKHRGVLVVDKGAVNALLNEGGSLLPVGVKKVSGSFVRGDLVACQDESGHVVASGLVNYSSVEVEKIKGKKSDQIINQLGYVDEYVLVHRGNMVVEQQLAETRKNYE